MSDTVYLPELTRKKKIWDRYEPSSFRVLGDEAMNLAPFFPYNDFRGPLGPARRAANDIEMPHNVPYTSVLPCAVADFRANNPHPHRAKVIEGNVMTLMEPICDVTTNDAVKERGQWWPQAPSKMEKPQPPVTCNTTYRTSYLKGIEKAPPGSTRHSANPNKVPAKGTIPVSGVPLGDDDPKLYLETKSFEMMYDARKDPNYPIRGKRAGAFVWEPVSPLRARNFLEYRAWLDKQMAPSQHYKATSLGYKDAWIPLVGKPKIKDRIPKGYVVYPANMPAKAPTPYYMRGPPEPLTESLVNADIDTFSKPEEAKLSLEKASKPAEKTKEFVEQETGCSTD